MTFAASARRPRIPRPAHEAALRLVRLRGAALWSGLAALLCACAGAPPGAGAGGSSAPRASTAASPAPVIQPATPLPAPASTLAAPTDLPGPARTETTLPDVKTRNALFKTSSFAELPGWGQDDLDTAWDAFQTSCLALSRREAWKPLCARAARLNRNPAELRRFFEQEFALFRILNTDASRDGDVTGYYEPLINGSLRPEGPFTVPVYATPNDLYTLDWKAIPPAQRHATVFVVKAGQSLSVVPGRVPGSYALDTNRFELDTRDRTWRVQLVGERALPYRTRAEIEASGPLDAPVVAWVDDALALYAMQVQGSGRIRLRDGTVLRVQYAEQNGHPFRPVRLVSKAAARVRTRSIGAGPEEAETFELADAVPGGAAPDADSALEGVTTRSLKQASAKPAANTPASDALVDELLSGAQRKPAPRPAPATAASQRTAAAPARSSIPGAPRSAALGSDPSYVFFRVASDQSPARGPVGALGVPLTAGRSIAVDPRITPLGYPVYMSAPTPAGSSLPLQRLVVAQDTGGAIRGAIRADFFWGSGNDAGRQAMRTRQRGQMWLMLPHAEAAKLRSSGLLTRGIGGAARVDAECVVADDTFCSEPE
ncbi:MAG: MltA domain-containing protein [Burkholderiales bacterium]